MPTSFSTKARTLLQLENIVKKAQIPKIKFFEVGNWYKNKDLIFNEVLNDLDSDILAVRSSSISEDSENISNAGAFLSILDVKSEDLKSSIEKVIKSYSDKNSKNEVLIQPMLQDVIFSGVAFSHDPNTHSPYIVINYSKGPNTSLVTSGLGGKTWKEAHSKKTNSPYPLNLIIPLLKELLTIFKNKPLDFEFAITRTNKKEVLWLLQARPLVLKKKVQSEKKQYKLLRSIAKKIDKGMKPHPFLMGQKSAYGVMPDWNPAEIIGIRPKPLSLSLYRELITDSIWAYQRHNYGYRNLRSFPLMPHFYGLPFIDIRASFNSFIPATLPDKIAGRLVDYYMKKLTQIPSLHDKVEFEIVFSCYTLDLRSKINVLNDEGFSENSKEEICNSLLNLTNKIIHPEHGLWRNDANKLEVLEDRRNILYSSNSDILERIYWLIEDGKRYGTLPFAGLARAGFIAVQMLKSLVSVGIFNSSDYKNFLESISTVSGQLTNDRNNLDKTTFLSRYGHLRPGTYDIMSPRYDEKPNLYFDWNRSTSKESKKRTFSLEINKMRNLSKLLKSHEINIDPVGLFDFMQAAIEWRELSKFKFSKNLSDTISLIQKFGYEYGFNRNDLSYCDYNIFKELHVGALDPKDIINESIKVGKLRFKDTESLSLPPLISSSDEIWGFYQPEVLPNFITQKSVTAKITTDLNKKSIKDKIVCIPNADPGFDWLFSYKISGLITMWGGVNSHMAIRSGELALPAVIGAGEKLYNLWSSANLITLDCQNQRLEIIN